MNKQTNILTNTQHGNITHSQSHITENDYATGHVADCIANHSTRIDAGREQF